MDLVEIEITGQVITARYGTLNSGAVLRTDAAFAKHLVEDCASAKYLKPKVAVVLETKVQPRAPSRKRALDTPPAATAPAPAAGVTPNAPHIADDSTETGAGAINPMLAGGSTADTGAE